MGRFFIVVCVLLAAGCSSKPHWSPYTPQRPEEWHSGRMLIANFDTNNDGTVTRGELEAGLRQNFRQADTNHDGRLDPDEIVTWNQRLIRNDESAAMPIIDWNHDGYVDFDEFATGIRSQFDELDTNGDGEVTLDEFRHAQH